MGFYFALKSEKVTGVLESWRAEPFLFQHPAELSGILKILTQNNLHYSLKLELG